MGDLSEACFPITQLHLMLIPKSLQLKPIPIATDDAIAYNKVPVLLMVNGSVTFIDNARDSFYLTPLQYVSGGSQTDAISIHAILNKSSPFAPHPLNLPEINHLVSFTRRLFSFEANTESGTGDTVRVLCYCRNICPTWVRFN